MEKFFWADKIAEDIIKQRGKKKEFVCASGITPSGTVHIGNFREIITTDLVVRALKDKGKKVKFIYSWEDYIHNIQQILIWHQCILIKLYVISLLKLMLL